MGDTSTHRYNSYQWEIYGNGLQGRYPTVTTDPNKLQAQAMKILPYDSYFYVAGGAGEKSTMDANRLAFRQWKIVPRMLRPTASPNISTTLFGIHLPTPVLFAPVGVQSIIHADAEAGVASIAASLKVPFIQSTASTVSLENVAAANGSGGHRWYQLYWPHDDAITASLLARAKKAGFEVLVVTLDTSSLGYRPADLDRAYIPFPKGIGNEVGFSDPVFQAQFRDRSGGKEIKDDIFAASRMWQEKVFGSQNHTWEDISFLQKHWEGPIVLKGIQDVDDAKRAVEVGVQGIVVSNHGGRQVDGGISSLDALPGIVEAVDGKLEVLMDSGVRTGADIIKALCLGAKGVLIGRPYVYGLAVGGKEGARDVMKGILADFEQTMALAGLGSIEECKPERLRRITYGEGKAIE